MSTLDPALAEHAARLLVGTDLTAAAAPDVAAGRVPASGAVAAALRDGWDAAQPAPATLTPVALGPDTAVPAPGGTETEGDQP